MSLILKSAKYNYLLLPIYIYEYIYSETNILPNQNKCLWYLANIECEIKLGMHFDAFVK